MSYVACGLTAEQYKQFATGCWRTWDTIASDLFTESKASIPRSHVVELVCDADRLLTYGSGAGGPTKEWKELYDTVFKPMLEHKYNTPSFKRMMKEVFHYSRYGP